MADNFIPFALIAFSVSILLTFLSKSSKKEIKPSLNGNYTLRLNKAYKIIGLISISLGFILLIFLLLINEPDKNVLFAGIVIELTIFWGTGIPLTIYFYRHKIFFNDSLIRATNFYGKTKELKWNEIVDIKHNALSSVFVVFSSSSSIKIHQHLVGIDTLFNQLEKKTKWNRKNINYPFKGEK